MKMQAFLKSFLSSFVIFSLLFFSSGFVFSASGAIWTTTGSCGDPQQNVNHYPSGSIIFINGKNFDPNVSYAWDISDPGINGTVYLNGFVVPVIDTDNNGLLDGFCIAAGVVPDGGPYQTKVDNVKGDNFSVNDNDATPTTTAVPTSTPTATPTVQPTITPTPTPTPTVSPTETPTPTPTLSPSGPPSNSGNSGGQVLGTSTSSTQGQVLGASTVLGATGTDFHLMILMYIIGGLAVSSGVGMISFAKQKSS